MAMETGQEALPQTIIQRFESVFHDKVEKDDLGKDSKLDYRALKETLRERAFYGSNYSNSDVLKLAGYLSTSSKYSNIFREWIKTRELEWELGLLPQNVSELYSFGRTILGKK